MTLIRLNYASISFLGLNNGTLLIKIVLAYNLFIHLNNFCQTKSNKVNSLLYTLHAWRVSMAIETPLIIVLKYNLNQHWTKVLGFRWPSKGSGVSMAIETPLIIVLKYNLNQHWTKVLGFRWPSKGSGVSMATPSMAGDGHRNPLYIFYKKMCKRGGPLQQSKLALD